MKKRTGKFYFRNEKELLSSLGLTPAPQSGAGDVVKEDGENERIMVQLKSTDSDSYRLQMLDVKKLEYHAEVSHKVPVFLIQFLKHDKVYAVFELDYLEDIYNSLLLKKSPPKKKEIVEEISVNRSIVKSSKNAREKFLREREKQYEKRKKR